MVELKGMMVLEKKKEGSVMEEIGGDGVAKGEDGMTGKGWGER